MDLPAPFLWKAYLRALPDGALIWVHFNPASLVYTVENSGRQQKKDPKRRQFAGQFTGKLTMDLQFDTTHTGDDVRETTNKIAMFMQSSPQANQAGKGNASGANAPAQPVLLFSWGLYDFKGYMESFRETIDFFSADGVPLRATVSIGLARQDDVFDQDQALIGTGTGFGSVIKTSSSASTTDVTRDMGDPKASRALAAANGLENLRFTAGASLQVSAGIQLNAAAGFAAGASAGGGISGGAGISAGAGASAGVSLSGGGGALFGATASAGVPATAGAFAGLETGRAVVSTTAQLNPLKMMPATVASDVSVGANASFTLGGAASSQSSFSADVGASFSFSDRLVFDSD